MLWYQIVSRTETRPHVFCLTIPTCAVQRISIPLCFVGRRKYFGELLLGGAAALHLAIRKVFFFPLSLQPFVPPCPAAASAAAACETNPTPPDSALSEQPLEPNQCTAQDTHMERQDWLVFPLESSFLIHAVGTLTSAFPRRAKLARDMAPHIARGLVLLRLDSAEMAQTKH